MKLCGDGVLDLDGLGGGSRRGEGSSKVGVRGAMDLWRELKGSRETGEVHKWAR